jgi:hypothetical protein
VNDTLQFPLPLLAYERNVHERLEVAITYATITTGMHRLKVLSPSQVEEELAEVKLPKRGREISDEEIKIMALGCTFCGVYSPETTSAAYWRYERYNAAENFLRSWKSAGRTVPWTRVPKNMVFEARDRSSKTYQRFTALCAVNAAIGSKPFAIVTRNRVRAGMFGYSSGKLLFDKKGDLTPDGRTLLDSRQDQPVEPVTTSQARTLLDNLVESGLLKRFTPYRGSFTYYSKTLSAEQIAEALIKRAERNTSTPKLKQLGERLRRAKQGQPLLSGESSSKSPHNTDSPLNTEIATPSPPDDHPIATSSPHNAAFNASLNASKNASLNAGDPLFEKKEETIKEHQPDGGEPSLAEVLAYMESRVSGAGEFAGLWLKTMKKRGWIDKGQPVTNWKPLADDFADGFKKPDKSIGR